MATEKPKKPRGEKSNRGRKPDENSMRSLGTDRHAEPRVVFHCEQELLDALEAYRASLPHDPGRSQIVRDALRDFLRDKGFFRPASDKPTQ